ncbi:unnamed protein product [Mytilus coruscus]|uniref:Cytochrome c oxidase polypeptide II n=1 Tax=Mytilus coruscus TaxID=42192 RepID=A0A6J8DY10_MYTCO|nr:unnamed protein product [Mytilus coruscus]
MSPRCVHEPENISNGYYVGTKSSYNHGDQLHYVCSQHYVMIGNPTVTCTSGSWTGGHPSCRLSFLSNAYFYLIGAIVMLIFIVVLGVFCVFCCKYRYRRKRVHDDDEARGNLDKDKAHQRKDQKNNETKEQQSKINNELSKSNKSALNFSKSKSLKISMKSTFIKKKQNVSVNSSDKIEENVENINSNENSSEIKENLHENNKSTTEKQSATLGPHKVAVELGIWKPFTHPIRNINTSTK